MSSGSDTNVQHFNFGNHRECDFSPGPTNMHYKVSVRVNLGIIVLGAIVNLIPLFLDINDDIDHTPNHEDPSRRTSILSSFFMVLIPAADLLIDLSTRIFASLFLKENSHSRAAEVAIVTRLTDLERGLFIVGVVLQSGVGFLSSSNAVSAVNLYEESLSNSSVLFLVGPIVTFLERCTSTFTESRTLSMLITFALGVTSNTFFYYFEGGTQTSMLSFLFYSGKVLIPLSGFLFVITVLTCFVNYCKTRQIPQSKFLARIQKLFKNKVENFDNNENNDSIDNKSYDVSVMNRNDVNNSNENYHELYANYIPSIHMIAILIISFASFAHNYICPSLPFKCHQDYVILVAEVIVLVLEYRIRKNEIAKGLVSLHVLYFQFSFFRFIFA